MSSWNATKEQILPTLERVRLEYPEYQLVLAGHSLGGAAAGLAALEFKARGWDVEITTFGEPRLGNEAMAQYLDRVFPWNVSESKSTYRRVTHIHDPVPMLPFEDWGWRTHGGEIFISKYGLPPSVGDLERCEGDDDARCIHGATQTSERMAEDSSQQQVPLWRAKEPVLKDDFNIPSPTELWYLLFAHREYFWRLGLCFDPQWRDYPRHGDDS